MKGTLASLLNLVIGEKKSILVENNFKADQEQRRIGGSYRRYRERSGVERQLRTARKPRAGGWIELEYWIEEMK